MDTAAHMHERHARLLGRLAELGMALAEDLSARSLAADTPADAEKLASGFHKLSRSVRQSLALEARLRRDADRARREVEVQAEAEAARPAARRRAEVKARLDRLIWTEAEDMETARHWTDGAPRLLAEAEFADGFTTRPAAEVIEDLARALRDATPPSPKGPGGEPETVIFEWRIVDPENPPPQGEGDRDAVEGVGAHSPPPSTSADTTDAGGFNPLSPSGTAPPGGEHLEVAAHQPRKPIGLPGEFGPNGETGEDRVWRGYG